MTTEYAREPCPWRVIDDCGGAFTMGLLGGTLFNGIMGARHAPTGMSRRALGGLVRIKERAPVLGGQFAAWGLCFASFDCSFAYLRQKEDSWNSIMSGAAAGAVMSARNGPKHMLGSAIVGGVLLGLIEGVGIMMNKFAAESYRQPPEILEAPQDPSILGTLIKCNLKLHYELTDLELSRHFGVRSAKDVNPESYEVISFKKEYRHNGFSKRNGGNPTMKSDPVFILEAFGKNITLHTRKNHKLLHPNASMVTVDGPQARLSLAEEDDFPEDDCHYFLDEELGMYEGSISNCNGEMEGFFISEDEIIEVSSLSRMHNPPEGKKRNSTHLIEIGVFLGPEAYKSLIGYFNTERKIREFLLTFVNGMQSLYHYPSLQQKVEETLLKNFCKYQASKNPVSDSNVKHWDIALFLSGLDFWARSGGRVSYSTMGLATVTGICTQKYGCVIGEIGVNSKEGAPYPSTGFTSVYVMAHEIGHNLGMNHDGTGNNCPKDGFVMSGSRGTKGETSWSTCSATFLKSLNMECLTDRQEPIPSISDHNKYGNKPGYYWSADDQCRFLLQNKDAEADHTASNLDDICYSLKCRVSGKRGYWRSGPSLDGTRCDVKGKKICLHGKCVKDAGGQISTSNPEWSSWKKGKCTSGCIIESEGKVELCTNYPKCERTYKVSEWASMRCQDFMDKSSRLKAMLLPRGRRAQYNRRKPDVACMVFCRNKRLGKYYTPLMELNNYKDIDVYFPDGSWCHNDGTSNYYCINHKCTSTARGARAESSPEILVNQNAKPDNLVNTTTISDFFTLDEDGKSSGDVPPKEKEDEDDAEFVQDDGFSPVFVICICRITIWRAFLIIFVNLVALRVLGLRNTGLKILNYNIFRVMPRLRENSFTRKLSDAFIANPNASPSLFENDSMSKMKIMDKYLRQSIKIPSVYTRKPSKKYSIDDLQETFKDHAGGMTNTDLFFLQLNNPLTPIQTRRLAYEYAIKNEIVHPKSWDDKKVVGMDWIRGFLGFETSLLASGNPNQHPWSTLTKLFDKYISVLENDTFENHRIYKLEEIGITSTPKTPNFITTKGCHQIGQVVIRFDRFPVRLASHWDSYTNQ
ncbi:Mitochondrial import inner membrane translocase subunit TIM17-1,Mitochondrial import inner membrane translocase subunit Tim17-A,Probable mitochondrial import inner membrane translocase subunit Tim17 4,Mitochondrial import inner membrane translocase subunit TIM17,Probable mitochondrial import inner membrane translocase subunit Tim17 3,Probable mitochondrial import inner membrane translocase subunit Tim17 1,Mitochondrial import inner membrane translocase subunit Tim17-B,Probable mitochondrial import inner me|uniref:Peptidase M12B domain-containing protein n=1 Tax=Lepeophtheirus salmonis TaxID=72036 RepID=A0A7R8GZ69_LEPSM|nr:Mitochondrial import inner membrane translocase subunit TIM17-1,Mitochondrial import inner membrane translocase subunit Tim17-A,Probable mitochondrial import inner membrane translocase subunit Tim17 4,Mitochondrial import inner membrane translocase subunit TIM17,Probable mitochondrial import inner membrane translocase subunit Tim17 3,Probable mitochondrial import inner membrane translocase subunit Tim17 1,Mitochondrial import inner membrane translocase subunit Tim17-B,Probable mitochondrial impo